jgi:hypothetical protein
MLGKRLNPFCSSDQRKAFSPLAAQNYALHYTEATMTVLDVSEIGTTASDVTLLSDRRLTSVYVSDQGRDTELFPSAAGRLRLRV